VDLELSDDEAALRDNVRSVLAGICPPSVPRSVHEGQPAGRALWAQMVELGWPALAIDERHGGLGLGFVELTLVAEELGRVVAPTPWLATACQFAPAVRELGAEAGAARFLPPVADGTSTGTLAIAERGRWAADAVATAAREEGDTWVIDGEKCAVMDGASADEIVVVARGSTGLGAFVVARSEVVATPRRSLDPTIELVDVRLDDVRVEEQRVLARPGDPGVDVAVERVLHESAVTIAAMTVGACRRIVEDTVEYAKVREQFGRPIGSFQALQHRLVDMYLSVERATALVYYAALSIAEEADDRALAASAAKAAAGDCQRLVAEDGLQLHGGVGFTWENDLHLFLKRAKTGDPLFGGSVSHRARIARLLGIVPTREEAA
jgi:alkylation response protein AidB-like acyl-CoA dehydrogenase